MFTTIVIPLHSTDNNALFLAHLKSTRNNALPPLPRGANVIGAHFGVNHFLIVSSGSDDIVVNIETSQGADALGGVKY